MELPEEIMQKKYIAAVILMVSAAILFTSAGLFIINLSREF
jgi:hypothetical protein